MSRDDFGQGTVSTKQDVQLVAGSIYGLRAFGFATNHKTGKLVLRSPSNYSPEWQAGEMVAKCSYAYLWESKGHRPGQANCSCGFYSYYRMGPAKTYLPARDSLNSVNGLLGVIEAYGRVTIGDRGMRSEKARIVGLVVPRKITGKLRDPEVQQILDQFPEVRQFRTLVGATLAFGINGRPKITQ